jgi:5'-nucleotidase
MSLRILITNDDGIHAPGLASLERIAARLSDDVWVVAPETEQSGAGRALTLSQPLRARRLGEKRFAVAGTPTDCVLLAVRELIKGAPPDLVLSGVNRGQNLAEDVTLSGTVAGAIEGMALGIRSMALSQTIGVIDGQTSVAFETAEAHAPDLIAKLLAAGWADGVILNLNFPAVAPDAVRGVEVTRQGQRDNFGRLLEKRTDLRGGAYYWMGFADHAFQPTPGVDLMAIHEHRISVTPLHIDLTHTPSLATLKAAVEPADKAGR